MPTDHTITPDDSSEPRFSEDDLDAALDLVRERADALDGEYEVHGALMIEAAEHFHRYLMHEC